MNLGDIVSLVGRRPAAQDVSPEAMSVADRLGAGLTLMRAGSYFEAHEELELAWRAADAPERDFFQGLVHVTVAWYQAGRGNRPGCERQLEKAARRLGPYAPAHRGVDVADVLAQVHAATGRVAGGDLALPPLAVPRVVE
jgi:predicted metal-dependent hydrolase